MSIGQDENRRVENHIARRARLGFKDSRVAMVIPVVPHSEPAKIIPAPPPPPPVETGYELAELVEEIEQIERRPILMGYIKRRVAEKFHTSVEAIEGRSRISSVVWARHIAIWLCVRYCGRSGASISRAFYRDHVTGMYAVDHVEGRPYRRGNRMYRMMP